MKKTYLRIEIWALAVISIFALVAPCAGVVACTPTASINAFVNQHVEFQPDPSDATTYWYSWSASTGVVVHDPPGTEDSTIFALDAPADPGTYSVDVLITNSKAIACSAQTCYGLNVYSCCPKALENYCTSDTPTWCWYDSCGIAAPFTPSGSIRFEWYINDGTTPISTSPCYTPNFENDVGYIPPSKAEPTKAQTVTMKVIQDTTGANYPHNPVETELYSCTLNFNLHWDPGDEIAIGVAFN